MKQYDELITVIVPVYNTEKYLNKCIDSIIVQTYENLEIILVDDGSTDNSGKICDEYAKKDDRIKVIHKENEGVSVARNLALDMATGQYIGFVDSDDYIEKTMYEVLYRNIVKNQVDISVCGFWVVRGERKEWSYTLMEIECNPKEAMSRMIKGDIFTGHLWNKLFKANLAKECLMEPSIYVYEDMLYVWKYLLLCSKVHITTQPQYYYIMREGSACNREFDYRQRSALLALDKMKEDAEVGYKEVVPLLNRSKILFIIRCASRMLDNKTFIEILKTDLKCFKEEIRKIYKGRDVAPYASKVSWIFAKLLGKSTFAFKLAKCVFDARNRVMERG